ncbi:MAG: SBBP repeat-containing protein [Bacteroidia bacterium]|nr:SBBP repeat-containing protein [Bacteroidota bacterium]MBP9082521.1 SBBP repeat-containing protein [Bacteroidia bacterium]
MKKYRFKSFAIGCLIMLSASDLSKAQVSFQWARHFEGINLIEGYAISVDNSGNVYTSGAFSGTGDFDPGSGVANLTSAGFQDIFISKLDASGNFVWAKQMGGAEFDFGLSVEVDAAGNLYTTGAFSGTVDFDPGVGVSNLTSFGSSDIFVSKLDPSGNFIWVKQLGGIDYEQANSIVLDLSGNIFIAGSFEGTADFDPGSGTNNLTPVAAGDIYICKLDASGNFGWVKQIGGNGFDFCGSLDIDASGNLYFAGAFEGAVDFDPGAGNTTLTAAGFSDSFVSKLDASGNFIWARNFSGADYETAFSVAVDISGNVFITGTFDGTSDFDPGSGVNNLTSAGFQDIFVAKLNTSGNFVWAHQLGSVADDYGNSVAVDATGNLYLAGYFQTTVDFNPGAGTNTLTSFGENDIFVAKFDPAGNFVWVNRMGGADFDYAYSIDVDATGNIYTTGGFGDIADFDPGAGVTNLTALGRVNAFVHKLSGSPLDVNEYAAGQFPVIYPNPNNSGLFTIVLQEEVKITITDASGRSVMTKKCEAGENTLLLKDQPNGFYFLQLWNESHVLNYKLVLNR